MARGAMRKITRIAQYGFMIAAVTLVGTIPAAAQLSSLFDALFGGANRAPLFIRHVAPAPPPGITTHITIRPRYAITPQPTAPVRGTVAYCVRLCDGRYFPLPRLGTSRATPIKSCRALCPATRTKVYWGSQIDRAVAAGGRLYSRLDTAFKFRRELVGGCTCNGSDAFGTADIDILADLTLRRGDIVVTENGLRIFVGRPGEAHRTAAFTPVENYADVPAQLRRRLDSIRVAAARRSEPDVAPFGSRFLFAVEALAQ